MGQEHLDIKEIPCGKRRYADRQKRGGRGAPELPGPEAPQQSVDQKAVGEAGPLADKDLIILQLIYNILV